MTAMRQAESGLRGTSHYKGNCYCCLSSIYGLDKPSITDTTSGVASLKLRQAETNKQHDLPAWHGDDGASSVPAQEPATAIRST